eukprot:247889_1
MTVSLFVCYILIAAVIILYHIRCYLNPQRVWIALYCHHCKSNRLLCTLMNLVKLDDVSAKKYTPFIPNWLINEIQSNTQQRCHRIDQFMITQSRHNIPQNKINSILFGNHIRVVAWSTSPQLQSISPLFNQTKSTQTTQSVQNKFKMYTRKQCMEIAKLKHSNWKYVMVHQKQINETLGWSGMKKSKNYLSTIADLEYDHIQPLKEILCKGRLFVSRLSGVDAQNIYCYVHFPVPDIYSTLHIHFSTQLDLYEMYRLYVNKRTILLEHVIDHLEKHGNVDGILKQCYMCCHRQRG